MTGGGSGRVLWAPPQLLRDWNTPDKHRAAGWVELAFDLIFVASALRLTSLLKDSLGIYHDAHGHGSVDGDLGLFSFFALHLTLFGVWAQFSLYVNRLVQNDVVNQVYFAVLFALSTVFAASIPETVGELKEDGVAFGVGMSACLSQLLLAVMYSIVIYFVERARETGAVYVVAYLIAALFYGLSCVDWGQALGGSKGNTRLWVVVGLWIAGAVTPMVLVHLTSLLPQHRRLPLHVGHFAERLGLLTMLVLGEVVISIVLPASSTRTNDASNPPLFAGIGAILVFGLFLNYYDAQPTSQSQHAFRRAASGGRAFFLSHIPLTAGLFGLGSGLKALTIHASSGHIYVEDAITAGVGLSTAMVAMLIIRMSHKGPRRELGIGVYATDDWKRVAATRRLNRMRPALLQRARLSIEAAVKRKEARRLRREARRKAERGGGEEGRGDGGEESTGEVSQSSTTSTKPMVDANVDESSDGGGTEETRVVVVGKEGGAGSEEVGSGVGGEEKEEEEIGDDDGTTLSSISFSSELPNSVVHDMTAAATTCVECAEVEAAGEEEDIGEFVPADSETEPPGLRSPSNSYPLQRHSGSQRTDASWRHIPVPKDKSGGVIRRRVRWAVRFFLSLTPIGIAFGAYYGHFAAMGLIALLLVPVYLSVFVDQLEIMEHHSDTHPDQFDMTPVIKAFREELHLEAKMIVDEVNKAHGIAPEHSICSAAKGEVSEDESEDEEGVAPSPCEDLSVAAEEAVHTAAVELQPASRVLGASLRVHES